jgi:hypothetical protein
VLFSEMVSEDTLCEKTKKYVYFYVIVFWFFSSNKYTANTFVNALCLLFQIFEVVGFNVSKQKLKCFLV